MKTLVMCPPTYFDVKYELNTNRWMDLSNRPNKALAQKQWRALYEGCLAAGLDIFLLSPGPDLPDMTFAANAGLSYRDLFIMSNFYHSERRPESVCNSRFFEQFFEKTRVLPDGAYFEGQGDAVWLDDSRLIIGYGIRTNLNGVAEVERLIKTHKVLNNHCADIEVIPLPMRPIEKTPKNREVFYHLDTCLLYIKQVNTFLVYPHAFLSETLEKLCSIGNVIEVTRSEACKFVCNSVVIDFKTIFMPWVNERIKKKLNNLGYTDIRVFPMTEFIRAGGAAKCLILEL